MANLTQLRIIEKINGFLLLDKPSGIPFSTVIKTVKRKFNIVKVGHGGSLDTLASGLLILLINDANKYVNDVMGADRAYEGTMRLGVATNTHDIFGEVLETKTQEISDEEIKKAIPLFKGDIFQQEPSFCSLRREGAANYEVASTGEHTPFMTHVYRLQIEKENDAKLKFNVLGSKSLIVRTLVNDFGKELKCLAALDSLRRVKIGKFSVEEAISFEKLLEADLSNFSDFVLPLSKALL